jgi:hypothetical protein
MTLLLLLLELYSITMLEADNQDQSFQKSYYPEEPLYNPGYASLHYGPERLYQR